MEEFCLMICHTHVIPVPIPGTRETPPLPLLRLPPKSRATAAAAVDVRLLLLFLCCSLFLLKLKHYQVSASHCCCFCAQYFFLRDVDRAFLMFFSIDLDGDFSFLTLCFRTHTRCCAALQRSFSEPNTPRTTIYYTLLSHK